MSLIQLKGDVLLGPDAGSALSYKNAISSVIIRSSRNDIPIPATLGELMEDHLAGSASESISFQFHSGTAAGEMWAELYEAMETDSGVLYFSGTQNEGATDPDNPTFVGDIVILGLDTGAAVGTLRQQSQTYPVKAPGLTKLTS